MNKGLSGKDVKFFKIFLILYADDIVIFAESKYELQQSLDALLEYCNRWKLVVNTRKTKIMKGCQITLFLILIMLKLRLLKTLLI